MMADLVKNNNIGKAWIVSASMGYGHQRAAYALSSLAPEEKIIIANDYLGISKKDKEFWKNLEKFYDFISKFRAVPLIGKITFNIFDKFQEIKSFYPERDLSKPTFQLKQVFSYIKKGWGKDLIEKLQEKDLPLICTFFIPAFMAEFHGYSNDIYCVIADADISRAWVSLNPQKSKIKYFVPTKRAAERLKMYGINSENILFTGFPLPLENIGKREMDLLKKDLQSRLYNLDSNGSYAKKYSSLIRERLGGLSLSGRTLTLMFAVGGAGAQKEIGIKIIKSLIGKLRSKKIKIILVAGIRQEIKDYFYKKIKRLKLEDEVEIIFEEKIDLYFKKFNQALRTTDILWTKPSELSFCSALGLPIIIAPPIGSQEKFNKEWLLKSGFAIKQENPSYTDQWLFDWINKGYLAECAMQGFIEGEQMGTLNIKEIII